jgi:spermidine synthase
MDYGNPPRWDYGKYGMVDPMVFRFIFLLGRIVENLGELHGFSICEIGPGNGILFKIITDIYPDVQYTFVDLESPMFILKKNVEYYGREANVKNYVGSRQAIDQGYNGEEFDLVISECAYNECYLEAQKAYMHKFLNRSARGRILTFDGMFTTNKNENPHLEHKQIFDMLRHKNKWVFEDCDTGQTIFWKP